MYKYNVTDGINIRIATGKTTPSPHRTFASSIFHLKATDENHMFGPWISRKKCTRILFGTFLVFFMKQILAPS